MPDETNVKIFLNSFPFGELEKTTRSPWKIKTVQQDLKSNNFSLNDAVELAQNCPLWRLMHSYCGPKVVSVAQLVARRTHDWKVVGSIPTNAVCFTVVR